MFIPNARGGQSLAFPNAYVSTDEPPRRSWTRSALAVLAMVGVGYLGALILVLSLVPTPYDPVTQFASDYGVGVYGPEMNSGFLLAGAGVASLGLAILTSGGSRVQKAGAALLLPAGLALFVSGLFHTDLEGAAATFHGAVHNLGGIVFFTTSPVGLSLISEGLGPRRFVVTVAAFAVSLVFAIVNSSLGLDAAGLSERVVILSVFSSLLLTAATVYRRS